MLASQNKLQTIQLLRAFAATSVLWTHLSPVKVGRFGVDIFFVISGYIICGAVRRNPNGFFFKRLARIVPLYWAATLAIFGLQLLYPEWLKSSDPDPLGLLKSLVFIPYARSTGALQPVLFLGWTLNYEMFFYGVFAVSLAITKRYAPLLTALVLVIGFCVGKVFSLTLPWQFWFDTPVLEFIAGIATFLLVSGRASSLHLIPSWSLIAVSALSIAVLVWSALNIPASGATAFYAPAAILLVLCALAAEGRIIIPTLGLLIGDASYSLYLLHPYVVRPVVAVFHPPGVLSWAFLAAAVVSIVVSVSGAILIYCWFERPANEWFLRLFGVQIKQRIQQPT